MKKSYLACLAILLVRASVSLGQGAEIPALPDSVKGPEPAPIAAPCEGTRHCTVADLFPKRTGVVTFDAEYFLWFLANSNGASPVATSDVFGTPLANLEDALHSGRRPISGGRFTVGFWQVLDNPYTPGGIRDVGLETVFFFVGQHSSSFVNDSSPTVFRPFFDVNNRVTSAFIVASPGLATGSVSGNAQANIWGFETNVWKNMHYDFPGTTCSVSGMAGFRYLDLRQTLNINSTSVFSQNLAGTVFEPFQGNTLQVGDSFAAQNRFYGGQIGIASRYYPFDRLFFDLALKLALGVTSEDLQISGAQVRTLANGTQVVSPAGFLALPSNIGSHHVNRFSQVPEIDLKFTYQLTPWLTVSTGFTTLYWSRILRPSLQIDRTIDITQIPNFPFAAGAVPTGLNHPSVPFHQSDLWLIGANFGAEVTW
jgi:hypothetical protein